MIDPPDRSHDPSTSNREDMLARRFPAKPSPGLLMILTMLWGAFIATQGAFALFYALASDDVRGQDAQAAAMMLPVFAGLSLLMIGGSLFAAPIFAAKAKMDYMTATLVRFAFAESIGIFGLVLGLMGLETYPYVFLGAAALVILVQMPTEITYQRYRRDCLSSVR